MPKGDLYQGVNDESIPASIRERYSPEALEAYVRDYNEKFKIVEICDRCDPPHPLFAHEVRPHILTHIQNARARVIIGMLMEPKTTPEVLEEVRAFLDSSS